MAAFTGKNTEKDKIYDETVIYFYYFMPSI